METTMVTNYSRYTKQVKVPLTNLFLYELKQNHMIVIDRLNSLDSMVKKDNIRPKIHNQVPDQHEIIWS